MGVDAAVVAALVLAVVAGLVPAVARRADGGFAEPGGTADALLTSWAVLGLRAAGATAPGSLAYLQSQEASLRVDRRRARRARRGGARRS